MGNNFEQIKNDGRLLYNYIRGSHAYGLNVETSDIDTSGVYICKPNEILGLGFDYKDQVSDAKHDNVWFEIGNYLRLLLKSNPTIMESLFIPDKLIIGDVNPLFKPILENKNEFISKDLFNPLFGYGKSQIQKAKGLDKMINWEKDRVQRRTPLDFCYTFFQQGSSKIQNWLEYRGLKQEYCGLVSIPNMHDVYGVYYDWGRHFEKEGITLFMKDSLVSQNVDEDTLRKIRESFINYFHLSTMEEFENKFNEIKPIGYRGILNDDKTSNELRMSSVSKGEKPICYLSYNQTGYTKHCIDYKNYKEWEKNRNPIRYESNLKKNYDSKNIMHCIRLMHMGIEIAKGEGFNVYRTWDREFLLNVRNHKMEFDEIMAYLDEKQNEFNNAIKTSTIRDHIDPNLVNDILIDIRKKQLSIN
jgi:predicted nucleotidyltransferase